MLKRDELAQYIAALLQIHSFKDYCPNGLQVQGKENIKKIISGVTACQALLDEAIKREADAVIVHHGYFWKGEDATITGIKHQRLKLLMTHDINLFAYHLPLDAHSVFGNNAQLALRLGCNMQQRLPNNKETDIVFMGDLTHPMPVKQFYQFVTENLTQKPLHIEGKSKQIETLAWCTGAAQDFIELAIAAGVDAYITGEVSERTVHIARETGIHFFACGHHATERDGVKSLAEHLAEKFSLAHEFIDIPNPV